MRRPKHNARQLSALAFALWLGLALRASADEARTVHARLSLPERVRIEAGYFTTGLDPAVRDEVLAVCALDLPEGARCDAKLFESSRPRRRVYLGPFEIDRREVDRAAYGRCVAEGACRPTPAPALEPRLGAPMTELTWDEAEAYCRFRGGHLPTEAQWERAASGGSASRVFPWGTHWNASVAQHAGAADAGLASTSSHPDGRSLHGLLNMAGNVFELVARDELDRAGAAQSDGSHVVRGGSFRSPSHLLRVSARARIGAHERRPDVGFRCAYEAAPSARPKDASHAP